MRGHKGAERSDDGELEDNLVGQLPRGQGEEEKGRRRVVSRDSGGEREDISNHCQKYEIWRRGRAEQQEERN